MPREQVGRPQISIQLEAAATVSARSFFSLNINNFRNSTQRSVLECQLLSAAGVATLCAHQPGSHLSIGVGKRLFELLSGGDPRKRLEFTKSCVNEPAWAEPLRLSADDIGGRSGASRLEREFCLRYDS